MNIDDALTFISARLQPDADPCISFGELEALLALAAVTDDDGLSPDDSGWTPTYSTQGCYRAIAEGWTMKHGRAVARFDFTTDGQTFRRGQMLDHIEHQRRLYARKVQVSPQVGR